MPSLIEELLDLQIPASVKLSPSGQQVLFATTVEYGHKIGDDPAKSTLWLAQTGKKYSARQITTGKYNDHSPEWNPDGKSVAFISDRGKAGEASAIYVIPITGPGEPFPLTPAESERGPGGLKFSPDGKTIAYLSADEKTEEKKKAEKEKDDVQVWGEDWPYNRLRLIDVSSKEVTTIVSEEYHILDFAWSGNGKQIAFTQTKTPHIESADQTGTHFSIANVDSKKVTKLTSFPKNITNGSLMWLDEHLYFIGPYTETLLTSSNTSYRVKTGGGETKHEKHAYGEENCVMGYVKAGGDMFANVEHGMEDQIRLLNGRTLFAKKKKILAWDAAFPKDSDEVVLAIAIGDTNHPTEIFTTTASGGAMVQLTELGKPFEGREFGSCTFLTCQSLDGKVTLECPWLTPSTAPKNKDGTPSEPLPTAVFIHGGPYGRLNEAFDCLNFMWTPIILAAGYAILVVDYRGSSGRGAEWAEYARGVGKSDYEDVIAQTQQAIELGYADKDRLLVGGYSQGGFLSYLASVRNGTHGLGWNFKASVPGAGVTDGDTMAMTSDVGFWQADLNFSGGAPWALSKNNTLNRQGSAIWEFSDALKNGVKIPPMLILHGEKDARVPLEQAVGMRRALESNNLPFEFVLYPREAHVFNERKHMADMAERVKKWCDRYIGGK